MNSPLSLPRRVILTLVGLAVFLSPARAGDGDPSAVAGHPLAAAIEELHDATRARLQQLEELRQGAYTAEAILNVEREIARTKLDFELGVLRLQLGEQKALGQQKWVGELTSAIEALEELRAGIEGPGVDEYRPEDEEAN